LFIVQPHLWPTSNRVPKQEFWLFISFMIWLFIFLPLFYISLVSLYICLHVCVCMYTYTEIYMEIYIYIEICIKSHTHINLIPLWNKSIKKSKALKKWKIILHAELLWKLSISRLWISYLLHRPWSALHFMTM
jgi:hypothetical protein